MPEKFKFEIREKNAVQLAIEGLSKFPSGIEEREIWQEREQRILTDQATKEDVKWAFEIIQKLCAITEEQKSSPEWKKVFPEIEKQQEILASLDENIQILKEIISDLEYKIFGGKNFQISYSIIRDGKEWPSVHKSINKRSVYDAENSFKQLIAETNANEGDYKLQIHSIEII